MPNSMTGFGKGNVNKNGFDYCVEIRSVNSRYRDIKCSGPKEMLHLEHQVEKMIQQFFSRGKFSVVLQKNNLNKQKQQSFAEKSILNHWKALDKVRKKIGLTEPVQLDTLVHLNKSWFIKKSNHSSLQEDEKNFLKALQKSLEKLHLSRKREGQGIQKVMQKLQNNVQKHVHKLQQEFKKFQKGLSKKIKLKLAKLPKNYVVDHKKYENDLVTIKDKTDLTEELDRLSIHLLRLKALLSSQSMVGREMDFLMQELNREINTIGSKALEPKISNIVILLKTDMEKLREQAQNLE